jgi:hypothetical protein
MPDHTIVDGKIPFATVASKAAALRTAMGAAADNAVVKLTGDQTIAGTKTFTGIPRVPNMEVSHDGASGESPDVVFEGERQVWGMGVDVANHPALTGGADFVMLMMRNPDLSVTDLIYVSRNKGKYLNWDESDQVGDGDNSLTDNTGYPSVGIFSFARNDTMVNIGAPSGTIGGSGVIDDPRILNRTVLGLRLASGATGKLINFYNSSDVSQCWMDSDFVWHGMKVSGNLSVTGHQIKILGTNRAITSSTAYTEPNADPTLLQVTLTPGYWEIGAEVIIASANAAGGGKMWLKFVGTGDSPTVADLANNAMCFPILASSDGGAATFSTPIPGTNAINDPVYVSASVASTTAARFQLLPYVIKIDYAKIITVGFSQQTSNAGATTLISSSRIWAKYLKNL